MTSEKEISTVIKGIKLDRSKVVSILRHLNKEVSVMRLNKELNMLRLNKELNTVLVQQDLSKERKHTTQEIKLIVREIIRPTKESNHQPTISLLNTDQLDHSSQETSKLILKPTRKQIVF